MTDTITNVKELINALEMFHPDAKVISREPPFTGIRLVPQMGGNILIATPENTPVKNTPKTTLVENTHVTTNADIEYYRKRLAEDPTNITRQKQLELMEDAELIYRISGTPVRQTWWLDIGEPGANIADGIDL